MATYNVFDFGKRENIVSENKTQLSMAEANLALVKAKAAANVQKNFLDLERVRQIRDLTRQVAVMSQSSGAKIDAPNLEANMYRPSSITAWPTHNFKRTVDGR